MTVAQGPRSQETPVEGMLVSAFTSDILEKGYTDKPKQTAAAATTNKMRKHMVPGSKGLILSVHPSVHSVGGRRTKSPAWTLQVAGLARMNRRTSAVVLKFSFLFCCQFEPQGKETQFFRHGQVRGNAIEGKSNWRVRQPPDFMVPHLKFLLTRDRKNKSGTSGRKEKNQSISIAQGKFFSEPWRKMPPDGQKGKPCGVTWARSILEDNGEWISFLSLLHLSPLRGLTV